MAKVFISFVGLGNYQETRYEWDKQILSSTSLAQVAMIEHKGAQYWDRLVFLFTKESREKHKSLLEHELFERLHVERNRVQMCDRDVPSEMNPENQWEWFETLLGVVDSGDAVTFDFTHGMRAVPIIFSSAISFLEKAKNMEIEHVLYAFYDGPTRPPAPGQPRPPVIARESYPIIEMRDFYVINEWADAVSRLSEEADARKLASLAETSQVEALQVLRSPALIEALQKMTDCIRNVDVNHVADEVTSALNIVQEKRAHCTGTARLLLELAWEKYKGLAFEHPLSGHYDHAYFLSQLKIIEVLLNHRLYMQAFTAIRECMASIGMIGLPEKYQKRMDSSSGKMSRHRFAEIFANMIQFKNWKFQGDAARDMSTIRPWWDYLEAIGCTHLLKQIGEQEVGKLFDLRNGFDHAWTKVKIENPADFESLGNGYLERLRQVVDLIHGNDAFSWRPQVYPTACP